MGRRSSSLLPPSPSHSTADGDDDKDQIENPSSSSFPSSGERGTTDPPSSSSAASSRATATVPSGVVSPSGGDAGAGAIASTAPVVPLPTTDTARVVWPAWDLRAFIVKSNDDLRQEVGGRVGESM